MGLNFPWHCFKIMKNYAFFTFNVSEWQRAANWSLCSLSISLSIPAKYARLRYVCFSSPTSVIFPLSALRSTTAWQLQIFIKRRRGRESPLHPATVIYQLFWVPADRYVSQSATLPQSFSSHDLPFPLLRRKPPSYRQGDRGSVAEEGCCGIQLKFSGFDSGNGWFGGGKKASLCQCIRGREWQRKRRGELTIGSE